MASDVVMVNGLPGSGKSTLAPPLAAALGATCLAKDPRYAARRRHAVHADEEKLATEWSGWAAAAEPLALAAVIRVDTARTVDVGRLGAAVSAALRDQSG